MTAPAGVSRDDDGLGADTRAVTLTAGSSYETGLAGFTVDGAGLAQNNPHDTLGRIVASI